MKKYLFIFRSELMSNLQYIFNHLIGFIGYLIHIFIFLNLWKYIYSNPYELINGYTMNQMIWYVIITEILWSMLGGRKLCKKICNDVKSGNIAYNINRPYSYIGYVLSSHLGDIIVKGIIYFIFGILLGLLFLGSFPKIGIISLVIILISMLLATIISIIIITCIGLISFFIEDANPFYWLYSKLILIVGTVFPIEYFPEFIQPLLKFSPVYVVCYGPAKLFVNFNINECISVLISQLIYVVISYIICSLIYRKGVKNLNVNGG